MGGKYRVPRFSPWSVRVEAFTSPEPNTGCWLWTGTLNASGYGKFPVRGQRSELAHRIGWQIHRGPIPPGMQLLHRCDTPWCVNPDHLFIGTNADNVADKVRKGRQSRGAKHGDTFRGEKHFRHRRKHGLA